MPSPITEVLRIIAEDWAALDPPDRPAQPYEYASDESVDPSTQLAHRMFWFEATRQTPASETSDSSLVPYTCQGIMVLDSDGYTPSEFTDVLLNEPAALLRAIELRTDWTDGNTVEGIWSVETGEDEVVPVGEGSTAVLVVMNFSALVGES